MPVTVRPDIHGANVISLSEWRKPAENAQEVLRYACHGEAASCLELIDSSFGSKMPAAILPANNGFVAAVVDAYSSHHHLSIRPEDVWFAVLTQLNFYINAHAEELRNQFVSHQGQKHLLLKAGGTRFSADYELLTKEMTGLIQQNVLDPELRSWIMPAFSTTTKHDTAIASILMMGSMQKYFSYGIEFLCGLPSITLLGEKADWELILARLDKLTTFGEEPTQFCRLLKPVLSRFVRTFEDPASVDIVDFWSKIVSVHSYGSGSKFYSGWIAAFCFWNDKGGLIYNTEQDLHANTLQLSLDGVVYNAVKSGAVPSGWTKVPVKINDNGHKLEAVMIAGSVGINCSSSGTELADGTVGLDSMSPETGWWIFEKVPPRGRGCCLVT